jgi:hypothetical protein
VIYGWIERLWSNDLDYDGKIFGGRGQKVGGVWILKILFYLAFLLKLLFLVIYWFNGRSQKWEWSKVRVVKSESGQKVEGSKMGVVKSESGQKWEWSILGLDKSGKVQKWEGSKVRGVKSGSGQKWECSKVGGVKSERGQKWEVSKVRVVKNRRDQVWEGSKVREPKRAWNAINHLIYFLLKNALRFLTE